MFRRCARRLSAPNSAGPGYSQYDNKERERLRRERNSRILYDAQGNLQLGGLLFLMWEDFHRPVLAIVGCVALFYGYQKLIVHLSRGEEERVRGLDRQSEAVARASGKLRSERYLVKMNRQIDDPDYLNIPSHAGKGEFTSKLFIDDSVSSGPLHDERNRS